MIRKVIGGFFLLMAVVSIYAAAIQQGTDARVTGVMAGVFGLIGLVLFLKKGRPKEEKDALRVKKAEAKDLNSRTVMGEHMAGLPLAQAAMCSIIYDEDGLSFKSSGNTFSLSYDKITAVDLKTSTEIQKSYVSSVGGAVAGAYLFGPLGAMVGGRAKEKKSKTVENFIIFTYLKEGNVDYISFKIADVWKAAQNIDRHKSKISKQSGTIAL